jgi:hypothetical protein
MKKLLVILLVLGIIEILYGVLWGRLQIYKFERSMIHELGLTQPQHKTFGEYITRFKDQWRVVAIFGVANLFVSILMLRSLSKQAKTPSGEQSHALTLLRRSGGRQRGRSCMSYTFGFSTGVLHSEFHF